MLSEFKPWSVRSGRPWTQAEIDMAAMNALKERAHGNYRAAQEHEFTCRWACATQPELKLPATVAPQ